MSETDNNTHGYPAEKRKFARIKVNLQIKFKSLSQLENFVDASTVDLSLGGMFIRTKKIKPLGTKVEIQLTGLQGEAVNISATVRSIRCQDGYTAGIGIEFDNPDETSKQLIGYVVEKHSKK
jgi:uncharacterized protein (TIGR02266 family)